MLTLATLAALQTDPSPLAWLAPLDLSPSQTLHLLTTLRKKYPPELAAAALETARLRQMANTKFDLAEQMFFTSEALQQATMQPVAAYHAHLLKAFPLVADLGCSIGGDALLLGQYTAVLGLDLDPLRLQMAQHNTAVYSANVQLIQADLSAPLPLAKLPALFFDPARRSAEKRLFSVKDYSPPLEIIQNWAYQGLLVKISPGVQLAEIAHLPVGVEFISYGGDLKEALLHGGELAFRGLRATRLPEGETLTPQGLPPPPVVDAPLPYLYEPDPAIIRSGLFGELLVHLGLEAYRLDESIAYLTGHEFIQNHWLRAWHIDGWMPFNLKKLKAELVRLGVGKVTVKKRGSPLSPEELQSLLALKKGALEAILILTQIQGRHSVLWSIASPR